MNHYKHFVRIGGKDDYDFYPSDNDNYDVDVDEDDDYDVGVTDDIDIKNFFNNFSINIARQYNSGCNRNNKGV